MRSVARCAALIALVPLLACTSFEQRVVAIENRQAAIEQQIAELQTGIMETQARMARIQADIDTALDPLRTQNADRGEDLRTMRREVTALEQQIDEFSARIAQLAESVASGGGGGGGMTAAGPAMPPARGQRTVDDGRPAPPPDDVAQALYNGAYNDYLRDNYELCIQGFEEFLRLYPTSARAANSQYWIGVCHREARDGAHGRRGRDVPATDPGVSEPRRCTARLRPARGSRRRVAGSLQQLAARGGSLMGPVTSSCGQMQGSLTTAILEASSRKANAADAHKSP